MFRFLFNRLNAKVDQTACNSKHKAVNAELTKGNEQFQGIDIKLAEHGELLARIDERTKIWAQKNGLE
ncbi:hypothetical protein LCGC14_2532090 [marine sediment metagenome]|uniref:Uncharacterized protein n=1 Tax=marine sediment metagenome TaxID=412755 RepID=A0A0F9D4T2_9ZZZZ